jgi:hypothetical protein
MISAETAEISNANGKVRSIRLVKTATAHAARIGEATTPTGPPSVRFARRVRSDDHALVWWEHHPRSTYPNRE